VIGSGLALAAIISLAMIGAPIVAIDSIRSLGARFATSDEVRSTAPIALILLVLAAPVLYPLIIDSWHGIEGPFTLPSDASGYVQYWRSFGIQHVPEVSIDGIFGNGARVIAKSAGGVLLFITFGAFVNLFLRERGWIRDAKPIIWATIRVGLIAILLLPLIDAAEHSSTPFVVASCAIPLVLVTERVARVQLQRSQCAMAVILLGFWALVVWRYTWFPAYGILAVTIIWKFLVHADRLNVGSPAARLERGAWNLSVACLGVGLLALDHGAAVGVFNSVAMADITDRVGVALVAPLLLIALIASDAARDLEQGLERRDRERERLGFRP
jgi:hypothetical protein